MGPKKRKSKKKAYFNSANPAKIRKTDSVLSVGMKGFLCTYNGNEKGCRREALNILDEYYTLLYPTEQPKEDEEEEDIEASLKKEIKAEKNVDRKFKAVDTGIFNCMFISASIDNVVELNEKIVRNIYESKIARSRYLIRLIPVEVTCHANQESVMKSAEALFDKHFKGDPTTYCVLINRRNNDKFDKMEITAALSRLVRDKNCIHRVDLKNPAKTVMVEVLRSKCCMSVVNDFYTLKKYNLIQLATTQTEANGESRENRPLEADRNESASGEVEEENTNEQCDLESIATDRDKVDCAIKNGTEENVNHNTDAAFEKLDAVVDTIENIADSSTTQKSIEGEESQNTSELPKPETFAEELEKKDEKSSD